MGNYGRCKTPVWRMCSVLETRNRGVSYLYMSPHKRCPGAYSLEHIAMKKLHQCFSDILYDTFLPPFASSLITHCVLSLVLLCLKKLSGSLGGKLFQWEHTLLYDILPIHAKHFFKLVCWHICFLNHVLHIFVKDKMDKGKESCPQKIIRIVLLNYSREDKSVWIEIIIEILIGGNSDQLQIHWIPLMKK